MPIPNSILVINGKGGVLKTSMASHLAGLAAAAEWDVLIIDADGQGNLSRDLGYQPDGGVALAKAISGEAPLVAVADRRPHLHYVSGGSAIDDAIAKASSDMSQGRTGAVRAIDRALAPICDQYHLVVIDSPPREMLLRRMLLAATRFFVVPTSVDATGIDGIADVLETVQEVREDLNPTLEMLGAAIGPVGTQAKVVREETRSEIASLLGDPDLVFKTMIRHAPAIARACREQGLLTTEYEVEAAQAAAKRKSYWKMTEAERTADKRTKKYSSAAEGLAGDWQQLVNEVMSRFQERQGAEQ